MRASAGKWTNQTFLLSLTIPFVKEGFPFLPLGHLITEEVRENDQKTVSDGDRSSFRSSACGDPAILLSHRARLLMRGRMSGLDE
jgi:hypothetical protein